MLPTAAVVVVVVVGGVDLGFQVTGGGGSKYISSMASKPINIRWIRTGSQASKKNHLQTIFFLID